MSDDKTQALKRLDALVGKWVTELKPLAEPQTDFQIIGTDTYTWMPGNFFLVHQVDVRMNGEPFQTTEMIGEYDTDQQTYAMRSFDSQGLYQVMHARVDAKGVWTFIGDTTRATLTIAPDKNSMIAHWEQRSDDSDWQPWMDMRFTKIR